MKSGSNMPAVGTYNQALVLDMIRRSDAGLSRSELAAETGLSAQTLSNVTRRLVAEGLVFEGDRVVSGPGKPRTLLHLDRSARFAVGVHLDPSVDTLVLVDLAGSVVSHAAQPPSTAADPDELIRHLASSARALIARAGVAPDAVLGIGVAAPGPLDHETGTLATPPLLPNWHHVALRDPLAAATGLPVAVEKDVIAALVGELWVDAAGALSDATLIYFGTGIGMGASVGGEIVRGRSGNSGDIGHLVVDSGGPECFCGSRGCFGETLNLGRILRNATVMPRDETPAGALAALDAVCERTAGGDRHARAALEHVAHALATASVLLNNVFESSTIVVGGPAWSALAPELLPRVRALLPHVPQATTTDRITLLEARLGSDLAAAGAACLILDEVFTARPSGLMIRRG
ncbi:ROK family transcriptional regulator [Microbacterium indicum]|uniref:ROK family transcriptional regulator n=1 Tax=Microbacterium indicum TaxID=358100 RepID=UPI0003F69033|nr:ROK family transcriptional regulator [Microbacterium indicum]